jgi:RHS repeat-associated protein
LWADVSTGEVGTAGQYSFNSAYSVNYGGQAGYYTEPNTRLDASDPGYRGLVLCTHRYYDPTKARWITRDPIGYRGAINLYEFVGGNPVRRRDSRGLRPPSRNQLLGEPTTYADIRARELEDLAEWNTELRRRNSGPSTISDIRAPDYYALNGSITIPYASVGLSGQIVVDRYWRWYCAPTGWTIGTWGGSGSIVGGTLLNVNEVPNRKLLSDFILGQSENASIGFYFGVGYTWTRVGNKIYGAKEGGLYTPQLSYNLVYDYPFSRSGWRALVHDLLHPAKVVANLHPSWSWPRNTGMDMTELASYGP